MIYCSQIKEVIASCEYCGQNLYARAGEDEALPHRCPEYYDDEEDDQE